MNCEIRKMMVDDIPQIYNILTHSDAMPDYDHISEETILNQYKWVQNSETHEHYVIELDEVCIGYCVVHWIETFLYDKPEGYISELFIHERFRGNKLGTELLNFIIDRAKEKGCCRIWLLNTLGSESNSRQYYEKRGFKRDMKDVRYILYFNYENL